MAAILKVLSVGSVLTSGAATVFGGFYYNSRETIGDKFKNECLPTNLNTSDDAWDIAQEKFKNLSSVNEAWKTLHENIKVKNEEKNLLKDFCSQEYSKTYKDMFYTYENGIIEELQKHCHISIKEKYKQKTIKEKSEFGDKVKNLEKSEAKINTKSLREVKESLNTQTQKKEEKLKNWCSENYEKPYLGEMNDIYIDFKEYCLLSD